MAKKQPRDLSGLIDYKEEKQRKVKTPASKVDNDAEDVERKPASFRIKPSAKKQFSILAKELDMTEQDLIAEAMNMVFAKYGKDQIAL